MVTVNLAIATNDRVDLEEREVKRTPEHKVLALQGLVLLGHQVSGGTHRRPNSLPSVYGQMMAKTLDAAPPD